MLLLCIATIRSAGMKIVMSLKAPSMPLENARFERTLVAIGMLSAAVVSVVFVGIESIESTIWITPPSNCISYVVGQQQKPPWPLLDSQQS